MSRKFNSVYATLNPAQKVAVDAIDGPVMLIAGPGTGKTQVLTTRIANILQKTDTDPRSILALTFTESAAKHMRERLVQLIGKTGYYVQISTFHAFCSEVINSFPEYFSIARGSEPLSDLERYNLFENIIDETKLEVIKPMNSPYFYIKDIIKNISDLKRENVSTHDYEQMVHDWEKEVEANQEDLKKTALNKQKRDLSKNQELVVVYKEYQQRLRSAKRFDFDDMIALTVEAFNTHEVLLQEYQENLHYFLVDEYQDTNTAQNQVVDLLASYWHEETGQPNVFVVGDPNQAIYRFQGASIENMLGFAKRYPESLVINLDVGYRCPQVIYDTASQLIAENALDLSGEDWVNSKQDQISKFKLETKLKTIHGQGKPIALTPTPSQLLEAVNLAEKIQELIKTGTNPQEIAVLYRHNKDRSVIQEALDSWGIKYEVEGGGDALQEEHIRQLFTLFQVIFSLRHATEDEQLYELFQYEWIQSKFKLNSLTAMKLARAAGRAQINLLDFINQDLKEINEHHPGHEITKKDLEPFRSLISQLQTWDTADARLTFTALFEKIINDSGYLPWLLDQPAQGFLIMVLNSIFTEVKKLVSHQSGFKLADFLRAIETLQEHGLQVKIEDLNVRHQAVQLATVHKAKGREWEHVFLLQVLDKKWGNNRRRDLIKLPQQILQNTDLSHKERNEDERRLFYVALTRAKKQVHISYPATLIVDSRSKDVVSSMFLAEINEFNSKNKLMQTKENLSLVEKSDQHLAKLMGANKEEVEGGQKAKQKNSTETKAYLHWILKDFKLSVTALNAYLSDETPDKSEFLQNNLLRVPRAKAMPMMFGSAVHAAMEKFNKQRQQTGEVPSKLDLQQSFKKALKQEVMTKEDFAQRLKYGQEILGQYHDEYAKEEVNTLEIERFFGGRRNPVRLDEIPLTGRIDRIDWIDIAKKKVKVIDYKTGKAKSKNQILGLVKSAGLSEREQQLPESIRGPYKRQLLFYKLLADLDKTFPQQVTQGMFDFVQPKDNGKFVRRDFELLDEEVEELKNLIKEVWQEMKKRWG